MLPLLLLLSGNAGNDALLQANGGNTDGAGLAIQNNVIFSTAIITNFTRRQAETLWLSCVIPAFNEYSTSQVKLGLIHIMLILGKQSELSFSFLQANTIAVPYCFGSLGMYAVVNCFGPNLLAVYSLAQ